MSIRKISFVQEEFHHLYNRGNDKRKIFHDEQDYKYFIKLLYLSNSQSNFKSYNLDRIKNFDVFSLENKDPIVSIGAYVLMPNHFHLLITQKSDNGISKFMQKLCTAYAMYYNKKYKRTGSLFEGKFKSQHLNTDNYLRYIFSYIHLNPIKLIQKDWKEKGIIDFNKSIKFLNDYRYSSYVDYEQNFIRKESKIINKNSFPDYFPTQQIFKKEIFDWLKYNLVLGKT